MIKFVVGEATDPGLDPNKRVNEDSCLHVDTPLGPLFIVCDGMGGHAGGKQASEIAVNTIAEHFKTLDANSEPRASLKTAVEQSAHKVYDFGGTKEQSHRPGSTCVAMLLHKERALIAHVGDSRCYGIRGEQIYQLTRDHSVVQQMLDNGLISRQQAVGHPDANKITRALGMTRDVQVELREEPVDLFTDDLLVLCTDGLTDMARETDIMVTVNQHADSSNMQGASDDLVALANRRGGCDNITVQVVKILSAGDRGRLATLAQAPAITPMHAGAPISTTIDGPPPSSTMPSKVGVVSPTIAEAPAPPPPPAAITGAPVKLPSVPPPAAITGAPVKLPSVPPPQSPSASAPLPAMSAHKRPPPQPTPSTDRAAERTISMLIKIVLILVALTGFLVAALLWALLYR